MRLIVIFENGYFKELLQKASCYIRQNIFSNNNTKHYINYRQFDSFLKALNVPNTLQSDSHVRLHVNKLVVLKSIVSLNIA